MDEYIASIEHNQKQGAVKVFYTTLQTPPPTESWSVFFSIRTVISDVVVLIGETFAFEMGLPYENLMNSH